MRTRGRPKLPSKTQKEVVFSIRLAPDEKRKLRAFAAGKSERLSVWARRTLLAAIAALPLLLVSHCSNGTAPPLGHGGDAQQATSSAKSGGDAQLKGDGAAEVARAARLASDGTAGSAGAGQSLAAAGSGSPKSAQRSSAGGASGAPVSSAGQGGSAGSATAGAGMGSDAGPAAADAGREDAAEPPDCPTMVETRCNGVCVIAVNDDNNCGGCGVKCESGKTCCGVKCVDTETDVNDCGACGTICVSATGNGCAAGKCTCGGATCGAGKTCITNVFTCGFAGPSPCCG